MKGTGYQFTYPNSSPSKAYTILTWSPGEAIRPHSHLVKPYDLILVPHDFYSCCTPTTCILAVLLRCINITYESILCFTGNLCSTLTTITVWSLQASAGCLASRYTMPLCHASRRLAALISIDWIKRYQANCEILLKFTSEI